MSSDVSQQKRLKYLMIVLIVSVIAFLIFFALEKIIKELPPLSHERSYIEVIFIDISVLEKPILKVLQPFEAISLPEDIEIGRENPFISY